MSWKSVVWAGCLVPVLTGCGALRHATSRPPGETDWAVVPAAPAPAQVRTSAAVKPPAPVPGAPAGAPENVDRVNPLPKPELPVIKPFNPPRAEDAGLKFGPLVAAPDPDRLPVPNPPLSVSLAVPPPSGLVPPVPAPLALPTILDNLPPIPFQLPPAP